jgi:hypothetical protein
MAREKMNIFEEDLFFILPWRVILLENTGKGEN